MDFLYWLGGLHNPVTDFLFRWITELGGETVFMAVAITVFWCVNKKWGYYIFSVGFFGTLGNQLLKLLCRIPRPWVLAERAGHDFFVSAQEGIEKFNGTGYSFPSGHAQNAAATFGGLALCARRQWPKWLLGVLIAIVVLVPFSRMYLGVHTPLDVGVGFLMALVVLAAFYPLVIRSDGRPKRMLLLFGILLGCAVAYLCYVNFALDPNSFGPADGEEYGNYLEGVKNGWSLTGALLGLLLTWVYDERYLQFEVKAPIPGQILKVVLGLALVIAIRFGLSKLFDAIFPGQLIWTLPRYFMMTLFAGCIWPQFFPFFQKLGKQKAA